jgi:hypothetical protein
MLLYSIQVQPVRVVVAAALWFVNDGGGGGGGTMCVVVRVVRSEEVRHDAPSWKVVDVDDDARGAGYGLSA